MESYAFANVAKQSVLADFANVFNQNHLTLTEFSFAEKGGSKFSRAIYVDRVDEQFLAELTLKECNVSFLADFETDDFSATLNKIVFRQGSNKNIRKKRIISFDIDFKDMVVNYASLSPSEKTNLAHEVGGKIINTAQEHDLPIWIINYSGNGFHLHFKLSNPLEFKDSREYQASYKQWLNVLTLIFGEEVVFDKNCSNIARLMRFPLSINWKDEANPIKNIVFFHNPNANGFPFFHKISVEDNAGKSNQVPLKQILSYFNYKKLSTFVNRGEQIVCSSPFSNDKSPSFYFHPSKQVFYDFSIGKGGGIYTLIAELAKLDHRKDADKVRKLIKKIALPNLKEADKPERYTLKEDGVWFSKPGDDGNNDDLWICASLEVTSMTRNNSGESWGRVLSFRDQDGILKTWALPMELLAGDGLELRKELLKRGLQISLNHKARFHLMEYIQSCKSNQRTRCIERIGWHDQSFILPKRIFCPSQENETTVIQKDGDFDVFQTKGTLQEWQQKVACLCHGNSRLIFVLAMAFAPPLLHLVGEESGGIHLVGPSSIGKTLALRVAGSVWGGGGLSGFVRKWRSTLNGLENLAESRCDSLLVLDEIAEIPAKDAAYATYMLANGCGKKRMDKNGTPKTISEWRIIFLSSGEIELGNYLREAGETHQGGQFVRLVDIEADAGKNLGIFDTLGKFSMPGLLADEIRMNCSQFFGTPIHEFIDQLVKTSSPHEVIRIMTKECLEQLDLTKLSGQVNRVAKRFALFAASGCLASQMGILPFTRSEILDAIKLCFKNWSDRHEGHPDFESAKILSRIRQYLQTFGCSQFPEWDGKSETGFYSKCSGYRITNSRGEIEWLVLNEVFKNEICKGLDFKKVIKTLSSKNLIKLGSNKKSSIPLRLPYFGLVRVYHLNSNIFEEE